MPVGLDGLVEGELKKQVKKLHRTIFRMVKVSDTEQTKKSTLDAAPKELSRHFYS